MAKAPITKPAFSKTANAKPARPNRATDNVDQAKTVLGIFVRSFAPTFRRAGFEFTQEGYGLLLRDLTEEQLKAIREEPMLSVQDCEIPAAAEDDALLQQQAEGGANDSAKPDGTTETSGGEA